jgi:TPR repeat protein
LAAEQGHIPSQNNLGKLVECGYSVPKNYAEAVRLYRLAAAQDDDFAQANLGLMLQLGRGVPHDGVEQQPAALRRLSSIWGTPR